MKGLLAALIAVVAHISSQGVMVAALSPRGPASPRGIGHARSPLTMLARRRKKKDTDTDDTRHKLTVIVDGSNVCFAAGSSGRKRNFDVAGLQGCLDHFKSRGIDAIAVCAASVLKRPGPAGKQLRSLHNKKLLATTPAGEYDDDYILAFAYEKQEPCVVVSNDKFRDWIKKAPDGEEEKRRAWVEQCVMTYSFIKDTFVPNPNFELPGVPLPSPPPPTAPADAGADAQVIEPDDATITMILAQRAQARQQKDYKTADKLLDQLRNRGVIVHDRQKEWTTLSGRRGTIVTLMAFDERAISSLMETRSEARRQHCFEEVKQLDSELQRLGVRVINHHWGWSDSEIGEEGSSWVPLSSPPPAVLGLQRGDILHGEVVDFLRETKDAGAQTAQVRLDWFAADGLTREHRDNGRVEPRDSNIQYQQGNVVAVLPKEEVSLLHDFVAFPTSSIDKLVEQGSGHFFEVLEVKPSGRVIVSMKSYLQSYYTRLMQEWSRFEDWEYAYTRQSVTRGVNATEAMVEAEQLAREHCDAVLYGLDIPFDCDGGWI